MCGVDESSPEQDKHEGIKSVRIVADDDKIAEVCYSDSLADWSTGRAWGCLNGLAGIGKTRALIFHQPLLQGVDLQLAHGSCWSSCPPGLRAGGDCQPHKLPGSL